MRSKTEVLAANDDSFESKSLALFRRFKRVVKEDGVVPRVLQGNEIKDDQPLPSSPAQEVPPDPLRIAHSC